MFAPLDSPRRRSHHGAVVGIGNLSIAINLRSPGSALVREITDLYGSYPQHGLDSLTDLTIDLRCRSHWSAPFRGAVRAFANGEAPFQLMPLRFALPAMEGTINWFVWKCVTRVLLLHAAVVERDGRAILLAGPSGAGKSTLCTALAARGWRFLTDEIAMVALHDGRVLPHPRPVSLKNDAIEIAARAFPDAHLSEPLVNPSKGTVAFMRPPASAIERAGETASPALVVFPRYRPQAGVELEPVDKARAFMRLVECSANYFTLLESGFQALADLVESCDHYSLVYESLDDAVPVIEGLEAKASQRAEKVA